MLMHFALKEKQTVSAMHAIEEFLKARPTQAQGWHLAGRLAMEMGDYPAGDTVFQRCLSLLDGPKEAVEDLA